MKKYIILISILWFVLIGTTSYATSNEQIIKTTDIPSLTIEQLTLSMKSKQAKIDIIKKNNLIACTGCRYCVDGCPKKIMIPSIFAIKNAKILNENYDPNAYSQLVLTSGKASDCIKCGKCEIECPQHLPIREYLEKLSKEFDR